MEELKDILPEVRHTEFLNHTSMEQLVREGEALEASEKSLGIWQSMRQHKRALLYSKSSISVRQHVNSDALTNYTLVLAAYSCAAVYVSLKPTLIPSLN